jgi:hypothetical protein
LSQRRAESARSAILAGLGSGSVVLPEIVDDVARRIKAVGMGSAPLINANFQDAEFHRARTIELLSGARTNAEYMKYAQLWRRCDLTVLGLEGEDEIEAEGGEFEADRQTETMYAHMQSQMRVHHMLNNATQEGPD